MTHVESDRLDARTFCEGNWADGDVQSSDWIANPEAVQSATCERCLLRLFMLGDSAAIALKRMGLTVAVHDLPADHEAS